MKLTKYYSTIKIMMTFPNVEIGDDYKNKADELILNLINEGMNREQMIKAINQDLILEAEMSDLPAEENLIMAVEIEALIKLEGY